MDLQPLSASSDGPAVGAVFDKAADYVVLETGAAPNAGIVADFFEDRPPGLAAADTAHFGLIEEGEMVGLMAMCFGYPQASDAYIGLLLLVPSLRGRGIGREALLAAKRVAQERKSKRLLIAVLTTNPRGRTFWEREGFRLDETFARSPGDTRLRFFLDL